MADEKTDQAAAAAAVAEPKQKPTTRPAKPRPGHLPRFHVVLLDDDDHTYHYVIEMLGVVFGYNVEKAFKMAEEVDTRGRVIVLTTYKELAELKRDQILAYGADPRMQRSKGSMTAVIEPAPE